MYTHVNMMSGGHNYVTTRNGHGQSGWSPIGCAAYYFSFQLILSVIYSYIHIILVCGFNPSEKYESQLGLLLPIYGNMEK